MRKLLNAHFIQTVLIKNLMMSKKRSSVTVIFRSEYCTNTYLNNSWNRINTEAAQHAIMVIYDVKYDNIQKTQFWKFHYLVTSLPWRSLQGKLVGWSCVLPEQNPHILWSKVIFDTQSVRISQKHDWHNIYVIMKTMCPPGYDHNGFVATYALGHLMFDIGCLETVFSYKMVSKRIYWKHCLPWRHDILSFTNLIYLTKDCCKSRMKLYIPNKVVLHCLKPWSYKTLFSRALIWRNFLIKEVKLYLNKCRALLHIVIKSI